MAKFVSNKNETIRLFNNPVLEYFSHIHPVTPIIVFVPFLLLLSYFGYEKVGLINGTLCFFAGILLWTLMEYIIHRWAFHYHPKSEAGKRIHFLVHGIHHDYPRDATRLVMPLLVSVPLAIFFYYLFSALFGIYNLNIFAGFIFGYVSYDSIHYATHHFKMEKGIGRFLKVYHLKHHYNDDHTAYGVSNPLWDYIFKTVPPQLKETKDSGDIVMDKKQAHN